MNYLARLSVLLLIGLLSSLPCRAATVYGNLRDVDGAALDSPVIVRSLPDVIQNQGLVVGPTRVWYPTNGVFTNTLLQDLYIVTIRPRSSFAIQVPAGSGSYNITNLIFYGVTNPIPVLLQGSGITATQAVGGSILYTVAAGSDPNAVTNNDSRTLNFAASSNNFSGTLRAATSVVSDRFSDNLNYRLEWDVSGEEVAARNLAGNGYVPMHALLFTGPVTSEAATNSSTANDGEVAVKSGDRLKFVPASSVGTPDAVTNNDSRTLNFAASSNNFSGTLRAATAVVSDRFSDNLNYRLEWDVSGEEVAARNLAGNGYVPMHASLFTGPVTSEAVTNSATASDGDVASLTGDRLKFVTLGSAAYQNSSAFDAAGAASSVQSALDSAKLDKVGGNGVSNNLATPTLTGSLIVVTNDGTVWSFLTTSSNLTVQMGTNAVYRISTNGQMTVSSVDFLVAIVDDLRAAVENLTNRFGLHVVAPTNAVNAGDSNAVVWMGASDFKLVPLPATGGAGGSNYVFTAVDLYATNATPLLLDLASYDVFRIFVATNFTYVFTNASSLQRRAQVYFQQDTNGGWQALDYSVAGGLLQTNASLEITTNASALDLLEVLPGMWSTNLVAWWPQNFQPRIGFGLAGGGGCSFPLTVSTSESSDNTGGLGNATEWATITVDCACQVDSIGLNIGDNNGGNVKVALYDSSGTSVLGSGSQNFGAFTAGWRDITLGSPISISAGTYKVAISSSSITLSRDTTISGNHGSGCDFASFPCSSLPSVDYTVYVPLLRIHCIAP